MTWVEHAIQSKVAEFLKYLKPEMIENGNPWESHFRVMIENNLNPTKPETYACINLLIKTTQGGDFWLSKLAKQKGIYHRENILS